MAAPAPQYRWNQAELAAGYDAAAAAIHPHYLPLQDEILCRIPEATTSSHPWLLDLGGGSGRLAARFLEQVPHGRAIVLDQSAAFLDLARERLAPFGDRGQTIEARLQDHWLARLPGPMTAIVSMSAIHHLEPAEKQAVYRQARLALDSGGRFLNGDEVRPVSDEEYLTECRRWAAHMHAQIDRGVIPAPMCEALLRWEDRNVTRFGQPRTSGDDLHETIAVQLDYLRGAGFESVSSPWSAELWALLEGTAS